IDATAPDAPQISHVTSVSTEVKGTAEANSTVSVTFPSGKVVETNADQDGNFNVTIPENEGLQGKETISATSKDSAGNVSHAGSTTVTDATAPAPPTVNGVTSQDKNISGTAEPNSTITIKFPNGETATGATDETGNYTIAIPNEVSLEGGEEIQVTSTDDAGNETEPVKTTVKDTTAPDTPTVKEVTSEDTTIGGTAEPGSAVTVTFPDGTTAIGTADDQGNYTIDITSSTKLEGSEELHVTATDKTGNISNPTSTTVIDKTAPDAPKVNRVSSEDVKIAGSSEPNSTVTITFPGNITVDVVADEHGNFIVDIPNTVDLIGGEEIQAIAQDKSNNKSIEASTIVVDATAPNAPTVKDITSDDTTIGGTAEPGSTVTVTFPDGTTAESKANDHGEYTITIPEKIDLKGDEELLISAMDGNGNISDSLTTTVKDTTAPEAPTVNEVTSDDTTIGGTAEPGSTVTITLPDGKTVTGTADDQGDYTIETPTNVDLKGGENIVVTATDKDGNKSEEATTTVVDTTVPSAPTVNGVTSEDTMIGGTAEPGSTVTVTFPDGTTATGTADDQGNYTIEIPSDVKLDGGEDIIVTSKDKDGNTSKEATTTVKDTTAPEAPTVNEVTSEDTTIGGT